MFLYHDCGVIEISKVYLCGAAHNQKPKIKVLKCFIHSVNISKRHMAVNDSKDAVHSQKFNRTRLKLKV